MFTEKLFRCHVGRRYVPVAVELVDTGNELRFRARTPYDKDMIEEIKCFRGRTWNEAIGVWDFDVCERNIFSLDYLSHGPLSRPYIAAKKDPTILVSKQVAGASLWKHQTEIYNEILFLKRVVIAAEMRTGKTLPTLMAIRDVAPETAWWVAPSSALRGVNLEIVKWGMLPWLVSNKLRLLTYEGFRNTVRDELLDPPQFIVFDECQKLKTPTAQQTEMAMEIVETSAKLHKDKFYCVGLSGTPAPKDPSDWWSVCECIRPGYVREGTHMQFKRRLGEFKESEGDYGKFWKLLSWKIDEVSKLYTRLRGLVWVYLKKDCLDIPAKQYEIRSIPPTEEMTRVAKTIAAGESSTLQAINKLRQLSDGFQYEYTYDEESNKKSRSGTGLLYSKPEENPKIKELISDLSAHEATMEFPRLVVYCAFQAAVDLIAEASRAQGWATLTVDGRGWFGTLPDGTPVSDTSSMLREMDRSVLTSSYTPVMQKLIFIAQTEAGGTGIELSASPTTIFYSNSNNGAGRMQAEDRGHSMNMDMQRGLTIVDYCHLPVDYLIRKSLIEKKEIQGISMGELKKALEDL